LKLLNNEIFISLSVIKNILISYRGDQRKGDGEFLGFTKISKIYRMVISYISGEGDRL